MKIIENRIRSLDDIANSRFNNIDNGKLIEPQSEWLELWTDSVNNSEFYAPGSPAYNPEEGKVK